MKKILFFSILLAGCATTKTPPPAQAVSGVPQLAGSTIIQGKLFSSVYMQRAAEFKAMCMQAYNLARMRVDEELRNRTAKPPAIIIDIDETVLDNSQYEIHQAMKGQAYEGTSWQQWVDRSDADSIAGAPSFLKYAASKGVEIFYVTNRGESERNGTIRNMETFHLPNTDLEHLIMKGPVSSKEPRRNRIEATRNVILYIGDNLADFSALFDKRATDERADLVIKLSAEFGRKFILIPNPVYGDWESAIYDNNNSLSLPAKDSAFKAAAKYYQ